MINYIISFSIGILIFVNLYKNITPSYNGNLTLQSELSLVKVQYSEDNDLHYLDLFYSIQQLNKELLEIVLYKALRDTQSGKSVSGNRGFLCRRGWNDECRDLATRQLSVVHAIYGVTQYLLPYNKSKKLESKLSTILTVPEEYTIVRALIIHDEGKTEHERSLYPAIQRAKSIQQCITQFRFSIDRDKITFSKIYSQYVFSKNLKQRCKGLYNGFYKHIELELHKYSGRETERILAEAKYLENIIKAKEELYTQKINQLKQRLGHMSSQTSEISNGLFNIALSTISGMKKMFQSILFIIFGYIVFTLICLSIIGILFLLLKTYILAVPRSLLHIRKELSYVS